MEDITNLILRKVVLYKVTWKDHELVLFDERRWFYEQKHAMKFMLEINEKKGYALHFNPSIVEYWCDQEGKFYKIDRRDEVDPI